MDLIAAHENYSILINEIKEEGICIEGFKVEYIVLNDDETTNAERLDKLKDIGYSIEGVPDYHNPIRTYALCYYQGRWCFGNLIKNKFAWHKHNQKPCSYSNSIGINIAKALVNIASKGDIKNNLLDACCGVGTIMLEACFAGYSIEGCDINWKICSDARENLSYFDYSAKVYRSDIKDINKSYDAAIIDLPYNLLSIATGTDIQHILSAAAEITDRIVVVSTSDIKSLIRIAGFRISDHCSVSKKGRPGFSRKIWVCEKGESQTLRLVE